MVIFPQCNVREYLVSRMCIFGLILHFCVFFNFFTFSIFQFYLSPLPGSYLIYGFSVLFLVIFYYTLLSSLF
jgi:hypothetical protein